MRAPEELLAIMDEHGIDMSFLSFPSMKTRENNDLIAEDVKEHADRFIGFEASTPQLRMRSTR